MQYTLAPLVCLTSVWYDWEASIANERKKIYKYKQSGK